MCKLQRKTFCLPCSKNIFKFKKTVEKLKTVEHCGGATVIDPELVIAINHSILGIFQNFKMERKLDFVSYISLDKLKFKKIISMAKIAFQLQKKMINQNWSFRRLGV